MNAVSKYLITGAAVAALISVVYFKVFIPKHTFQTVQPTTGTLRVGVQGIGNVSALNIYPVTAQTGGKILSIRVDEGQWVKKGDLLLVIDGVDLPAQIEMARASLLKAQDEVKALQGELASQKAQEKLLLVTYKRYKKLNTQGYVARGEFDKAQADIQAIRAALAATGSRISSAESAVTVAAKNIDVLQARFDRLKVHAPIDGYVISRQAEVAQYVQPATPVLQIVDPTTLWVTTKIDERVSAGVKVGQRATIVLRSRPATSYSGVVKRIDAMTDAVTLERKINVAFATLPEPFFINEQARVQIAVNSYENVTKVPLSVVVQKEGKKGVWVLEDGRSHFVALDVIAANTKEVGVANGDSDWNILVPDRHKKSLSEGMRIFQ